MASDSMSARERSAPGLAALFASLSPDGGHSILDFGPAEGQRLTLFGRFGRRVRFASMVPHPPTGPDLQAALEVLESDPGDGYDVVLSWDLFDRLDLGAHAAVMDRLAEVTQPGARLHAVLRASEEATTRPVRIRLLELDRVREEVAGPPEPARPPLLPAHVERLLDPFEVLSGISLRQGLREYVARRPE